MVRNFLFALIALVGAPVAPAFSLDKEVDLEIRRVDARLARVAEQTKDLARDMRTLQRSHEKVMKKMDYIDDKLSTLTDQMVRLQNVDISNLQAGQKGLYDQIPTFTWGEDSENCEDIKTRHQQTNTVKSADGSKTMRYLCFDGKAIHLGTEYHVQPSN